jgi:hypothetical protein
VLKYHLHIGVHRTGTTATQKLLDRSAVQLRAAGIAFRGPSALRGWGFFDVIQRMTDDQVSAKRIEVARAVFRDWVEESVPATRTVISDENLPGNMMQNYVAAALYPDVDVRLRALGALLAVQPDVVCVTIRDFAGYWQSTAAHLASRGKLETFDAERLTHSPGNSWLPFLQSIRNAFPDARLNILRYDDMVVSRLLRALVGPSAAASLPMPQRSFGLALSDEKVARLEALPFGREREALALQLRETRDPPERTFSDQQVRVLDAAYAADWRKLRAGGISGACLDPIALAEEQIP